MSALRCAIYTRKSSEEGLEQNFNSLHAQREACEAYVLSQKGEGWKLLPAAYDDGGFSGGSMQRPGVQRLIADIQGGAIDVVVVYKVDRLTRSLADFARLVELFDKQNVSFVSVTQAFNTTSSMGRLTLNVLLSFAQFEREVTGERIRDKIAASKARGLWMGGAAPLGYDGVDRKLVVNAAEAETVKAIFTRYLELGTVRTLQAHLVERDVRSKTRLTKDGRRLGDAPFSRGSLYYLLANPVYRGAIRHRKLVHHGAHPAIIDQDIWDRVQAQLFANAVALPGTPRLGVELPLRGRVFDDRGQPMRPLHTKRRGKRYRYYAAQTDRPGSASLPRIAMGVLDRFVVDHVTPVLTAGWRPKATPESRATSAAARVVVGADRVSLIVRDEAAVAEPALSAAGWERTAGAVQRSIAIRLKHRQGATLLSGPDSPAPTARVDKALLRGVCLARSWAAELASGAALNTKSLARQHGLCEHYVAKLLPLAWLAPDLLATILEGRQSPALTLASLVKRRLPMAWDEQRALVEALG